MIEYVTDAPDAPKAIGPYSQATICGSMIFVSGQIPLNPATGKLVSGGIEEQTTQVLSNLRAILKYLDLDFTRVVKTTIFLTDLSNFQVVNGIYERELAGSRPARATIQVSALPLGAQVEIEAIAMRG